VAEQTLRELRLAIRAADSELVHLLARRLRLVRKIGNVKHELKMPIVDSATEEAVIENYVKSASDAGIDKGFAKRVANLIIEGSVELQRSIEQQQIDSGERLVEKVAVIGAGGMGSWFARFFKSRGSYVTISDRDRRRARLLASKIHARSASSNVEAVRGGDIVILATPANVVSTVVNEILSALKENALLVDISAVKSPVMPALRMAEKRGVRVGSIHPLFGPLASGLREKNVVVVKTGRHKQYPQSLKHMLEKARILLTDQQTHDRRTALTLALPHFLNMAFAMTISKGNVAEMRRFAGRTFNLQMLLAESVASEPETTADIQIMNKEFRAVLRDLQRNIGLLAETVNRRDRAKLLARYQRIREKLSSDPKFALAGEAFEKACEAASTYSRSRHAPVSRGP
jgi:prephenate dehydrogenase/chorismate mutase